jgi:hypothetical protein
VRDAKLAFQAGCGCPGQGSVQKQIRVAGNTVAPNVPNPHSVPAEQAATLPMPSLDSIPLSQLATALPMPASDASDVHVQVDAPFVFRAAEADPALSPAEIANLKTGPSPSLIDTLIAQNVSAPTEPVVSTNQKKHRGFFGRVGGFFAAMFAGK